ncbi:hypothetical protein Y032_0097g2978 [Ancylostoma ceylanicum]|uniref:Uncharacterized protein n=1 Tax=Ancylostoma ceylanicum TaxID=53326 RepID=A0A016TJI1_9BILA|nr:hypothetical protein Y032_0097g2978 [Ancylostoma ceylanicum]
MLLKISLFVHPDKPSELPRSLSNFGTSAELGLLLEQDCRSFRRVTRGRSRDSSAEVCLDNYTSLIVRLTPEFQASFRTCFARVASMQHIPHTTSIVPHLSELSFFATSCFLTPMYPFHNCATVE